MKKRLLLFCLVGFIATIAITAEATAVDYQLSGDSTATVEVVGAIGNPNDPLVTLTAHNFKVKLDEQGIQALRAEDVIKYSEAFAQDVVNGRNLTQEIKVENLEAWKSQHHRIDHLVLSVEEPQKKDANSRSPIRATKEVTVELLEDTSTKGQINQENKDKLPSMGEEDVLSLFSILVGVFLINLAFWLFKKRRKKQK